jgi:hypothetical protein
MGALYATIICGAYEENHEISIERKDGSNGSNDDILRSL